VLLDADLLGPCVAIAGVVILGAILFGVLHRLAPGRELAGVNVAPGAWGTLALRLPRRGAYRVWACASIDGEERADVAAEIEATTLAGVLRALAPVEIDRQRWFATASRFHVRLWTLPRLDAGTVVNLRVRVIGVAGTSLREARVYVAT